MQWARHRVIESNGSLTGFGERIENKAKLLALGSRQLGLQWELGIERRFSVAPWA